MSTTAEDKKTHPEPIGLDPDHCRQRQERLRQRLRERGLDAAFLRDLRHVQYVTAHWARPVFLAGAIVPAGS